MIKRYNPFRPPQNPSLDWFYDSPPPKPVIFFNTNISWLLDTRKDTVEKKV